MVSAWNMEVQVKERTQRGVVYDSRLGEVEPDLRLGDLGVVDGDFGVLGAEVLADGDRGRLASVSGVLKTGCNQVSRALKRRFGRAHLLERETEDGDLLVGDRVEEGGNDTLGKATLLVPRGERKPISVGADAKSLPQRTRS